LLRKAGNARWSPAGEHLVYITYGATPNLVVVDLDQKSRTPLFEQGKCPYSSFLWNVAWSPDGKRIAFKGRRIADGKWELGIVDARGATYGLLTRLPTEVWSITWCGDCNRIFLASRRRPVAAECSSTRSTPTRRSRREFCQDKTPRGAIVLAWHSPDGKKLLIVSAKVPPKSDTGSKKATQGGR